MPACVAWQQMVQAAPLRPGALLLTMCQQVAAAAGEPQIPCAIAILGVLQVLLRRFSERHRTWLAAVEAAAQLDALMSLAVAAVSGDGDMCRCAAVHTSNVRQSGLQMRVTAPVEPIRGPNPLNVCSPKLFRCRGVFIVHVKARRT